MIWPTALRLANENRRLRRDIRALTFRLVHAEHETEQVRAALGRVCRDADLIACMAKDPKTALAVLRDLHRIDQLPESEEAS